MPTLAMLLLSAAIHTAGMDAANPREVVVRVSGVDSNAGHVRVDLCTANDFLGDHCTAVAAAPASVGETEVILPDVPPGVYAVQAYHDANDNHRVDRNALGIPLETFGFSRAPPLGLHGPTFIRAAFEHGEAAQRIDIRLRHVW